jgi:DNA-directed RNA polymerase subunit K/omega
MNIELTRKALEKVGNPHILVNLVSRRVRQLSSGGGGAARPLVDAPATMDVADIALLEIIEEKIGWEFLNPASELAESSAPKKKRAPRKVSAAALAAASATAAVPAPPLPIAESPVTPQSTPAVAA